VCAARDKLTLIFLLYFHLDQFGSWISRYKTKKQNLSDKESSTTIFWQIRDTVHFKGTCMSSKRGGLLSFTYLIALAMTSALSGSEMKP
jgi:hypothetical protein